MQKERIKLERSGFRSDRKDYSFPVMKLLILQIKNRRLFVNIGSEAEKGFRFKNDESIIARVLSNYTQQEFMADPVLTVDAMLIDAAQADWWYGHEKDYGNEEHELADRDDEDGE